MDATAELGRNPVRKHQILKLHVLPEELGRDSSSRLFDRILTAGSSI